MNISLDFDEMHSIPIEDINSIMVETDKAQLSSHVLRELAINGTIVYFCDEQHMPCGVLLPLNAHSRKSKVLHVQFDMKKPLKKRMWQQIVQQKVFNQAECLRICGKDGYDKLLSLSKRVQSGDNTYIESQAASIYFRLLFGNQFRRKNKSLGNDIDVVNAALNYGYSILRAAIARDLVVYGFEPSLGIFHRSETNRFNLADDLLEPFRPAVDLFTAQNIEGDKLSPSYKRKLLNLLNLGIESGGEQHSIMFALERAVKSLATVCRDGEGRLILPSLGPLKMHRYE